MTQTSDERFMRLAIQTAKEGIESGQSPFGACIARDGKVVCRAHNVVWKTCDITAHAEVQAIRLACAALDTIDLSGCVLFSNCEPCPMCFTASHWARIDRILFGARIEDARGFGFNELSVSNETLKGAGGSPVEIVGDFLREECLDVFRFWEIRGCHRAY